MRYSHLRTADPQPESDNLPPPILNDDHLGRYVQLHHFAAFIEQPTNQVAALCDPSHIDADGQVAISFTTACAVMAAFGIPTA